MRSEVVGVSNVFVVSDLMRSLAFYDKLGFGDASIHGQPPCFAMINRDGFEVMLSVAEDAGAIHPNGRTKVWDMYVRVENISEEIAALGDEGIAIAKGPTDLPYEMREIEVVDPDGYLICLAQDISE